MKHHLGTGHIIVSHHGKKEYGSPVLPSTPEAVVSASDELDFLTYCWDSVYPPMSFHYLNTTDRPAALLKHKCESCWFY